MTKTLNIASVQLNPIVGDLDGNYQKTQAAFKTAANDGADIVVFSETVILGYPGEDLQLKPSAVHACMVLVKDFAKLTKNGPACVYSSPWYGDGENGLAGKLYNAVLFLNDGEIADIRLKHNLPNYGVFDEARLFVPGPLPAPIMYKGIKIGLPICEDIWHEGVCEHLAQDGAELFIVPNGSPWRRNAHWQRETVARARIQNTGVPIIYVNQVGGQDELAFDGASFSMDAQGSYVQTLPAFQNYIDIAKWQKQDGRWECVQAVLENQTKGREADWQAMSVGLGDYVHKNRFSKVVLGLSGGIDSAMAATIAVDTFGAKNVWCVMLPSKYTSQDSLEDAKDCAKALGCKYDIIPIEDAVRTFGSMLAGVFAGQKPDTTEENIQSRIRALVLMALSNKFGHMLLTTGNKSELAVGYATLYGDMCGGYNPLKDLYKTEVFSLMRWRNKNRPDWVKGGENPVPVRILTKPPSAELREDQTDQDSLPPYDILDDILRGLVDSEISLDELIRRGHKPDTVKRIEHLLYINEYKRYQAPPGVKLGNKAFGRDRRYPLTNSYRDTITNKDKEK